MEQKGHYCSLPQLGNSMSTPSARLASTLSSSLAHFLIPSGLLFGHNCLLDTIHTFLSKNVTPKSEHQSTTLPPSKCRCHLSAAIHIKMTPTLLITVAAMRKQTLNPRFVGFLGMYCFMEFRPLNTIMASSIDWC